MIDVIALHRDDLGALCRRFNVRRLDQTLLVSVESMQASMSSRDNGGRAPYLSPGRFGASRRKSTPTPFPP